MQKLVDTGTAKIGTGCAAKSAPVRFGYHTPEAYMNSEWCPPVQPLAAIIHGDFAPPAQPWPQITSHLRPASRGTWVELVSTSAPVTYGREGGFEIASTEDLLFAVGRQEDAETLSIAAQTEHIYGDLLQLLERRGYPHLLRTWNILQDINREQDGLERYRQFCFGRYEAFARCRGDLQEGYPAASAVGAPSGGLCVYVLAAKAPGIAVENPNQVSAYHYPAQYGPRSPSFARGLIKIWNHGSNLFLSGTASITGHESRHVGQLAQQVENTLSNLGSLVAAAERTAKLGFPLAPGTAVLKVYIRNPANYLQVRAQLENRLGTELEVVYLQAYICRAELLCEIDGVVFPGKA